MSIPSLIHQTGPATMPAAYKAEWAQTWKDAHPSYAYQLWQDADLLALARSHLATHAAPLADSNTPGVVKGDFGRLLALYVHGGVYADLDYVCLKPIDPLLARGPVILSEMRRFPASYVPSSPLWRFVHNAVMAAEPGHPFIRSMLDAALSTWQAGKVKAPEEIAGPQAMMRSLRLYGGSDVHVATPDELCPFSYMNAGNPPGTPTREELINDTVAQYRTFWPDAYAVTFWVHQW